jgi:hypothetical protein
MLKIWKDSVMKVSAKEIQYLPRWYIEAVNTAVKYVVKPKEYQELVAAILVPVLLVVFLFAGKGLVKVLRRKITRLNEECLARAGSSDGKKSPELIIIRAKSSHWWCWLIWSKITEIQIKPAVGRSLNEAEMRDAIARIYHKSRWKIGPQRKGYSTFNGGPRL